MNQPNCKRSLLLQVSSSATLTLHLLHAKPWLRTREHTLAKTHTHSHTHTRVLIEQYAVPTQIEYIRFRSRSYHSQHIDDARVHFLWAHVIAQHRYQQHEKRLRANPPRVAAPRRVSLRIVSFAITSVRCSGTLCDDVALINVCTRVTHYYTGNRHTHTTHRTHVFSQLCYVHGETQNW